MTQNTHKVKQWTAGDHVSYNGQLMTVIRVEGLFCDLQDEDGHIRKDCLVSTIRPSASWAGRSPWDLVPPALDLSNVEDMMSQPISPAVGSPPVEAAEPPAAPKPPRRYRTEGYQCELCPELPPFALSWEKSSHVRSAHPKPKAAPITAPPARTARTVVNLRVVGTGDHRGKFDIGMVIKGSQLATVGNALNGLLALLDEE